MPPGHGLDGTKLRILEAAMVMFAEHGYHGASLRQIGEAAGIRAASIYEHFASKEDMLARLALLGHELLLEEMRASVVGAPSSDPIDQARALVAANVRAHGAYPMLAIVIETELHALSDEQAAPIKVLRQQGELFALQVVVRGIEQGVFAPKNLIATLAAIGGIAIRVPYWFVASDIYTLDDLAADYAELALVMLGAGPQATANTQFDM